MTRSSSADVADSGNSSWSPSVDAGPASSSCATGVGRGRLLEDGVHVGSRHPVRRHRGAARMVAVGGPRRAGLRHKEFGLDLGELIGRRVKCRFCGTTPCCSARIAFIRPSGPEVDWRCPKLVFTEPRRRGRRSRTPRPGWRIRSDRRPGCRCRAPRPCRRWSGSRPPRPMQPGRPRPAQAPTASRC